MKIKIQQRLFVAILAAAALSVISMLVIMKLSLGRGFLQYVNTIENEKLSAALLQAYVEKGNWEFLQEDPAGWPSVLTRIMPGGKVDAHLLLLDENLDPIFGNIGQKKGEKPSPLTHQGRVVSYLLMHPREELSDIHQVQFVKQQEFAMLLITVVILLLAVIFSLVITRRLLRPINALAEGTHRLAGGDYRTRVSVASADELGMLANDFNALSLVLENNEKAHRQWVADISHELRTPLAILRGELEALQDGVRVFTPETLNSLHAEAIHLVRLVEDLYQLSLYDIGGLSYRKELLEPTAILQKVVDSFRAKFEREGVALTVVFPESVSASIFADRERLLQLFSNLLDNSLKYTNTGGCLEILVHSDKKKIAIDFQDSAPEVPVWELDKLFDRLYRVEGSRNRGSGGAGLGLTICKTIVEAHEGTIVARPSSLGGLWISITLPLIGVE
ncbi:MAG: ATP-binding protein [Desulfobulbaceae bacterium]|nr:ATP-binding protein [Desulfobulbaceae bacterium]